MTTSREDLAKLKRSIERLCTYLHKNYYINYGGCCWLSYCLALNLERLGISYDFILYSDDGFSVENTYLNIKERLEEAFPTGAYTASHYTVRVKGMGILNKDPGEPYMVIKGIDSSDFLWIYENGDWNHDYNKKINNEIKNLVDTTFKIYEAEKSSRKTA